MAGDACRAQRPSAVPVRVVRVQQDVVDGDDRRHGGRPARPRAPERHQRQSDRRQGQRRGERQQPAVFAEQDLPQDPSHPPHRPQLDPEYALLHPTKALLAAVGHLERRPEAEVLIRHQRRGARKRHHGHDTEHPQRAIAPQRPRVDEGEQRDQDRRNARRELGDRRPAGTRPDERAQLEDPYAPNRPGPPRYDMRKQRPTPAGRRRRRGRRRGSRAARSVSPGRRSSPRRGRRPGSRPARWRGRTGACRRER